MYMLLMKNLLEMLLYIHSSISKYLIWVTEIVIKDFAETFVGYLDIIICQDMTILCRVNNNCFHKSSIPMFSIQGYICHAVIYIN